MTLVHVNLTNCPDCGTPLAPIRVEQPALFRHGGYGATSASERTRCPACGWAITLTVTETRPDRAKAAGE